MTSTLLLLLRGPLQAWGHESRYSVRETGAHPTKSGVLGLIAAAQGRRRSDPIEDLARLRFGVRVEQPGQVLHDYQTAFDPRTMKNAKLISRYFLADAVFIAGVEAERPLLEGLESALRRPRFALFLGRRSCPANADLVLGIREADLETALRGEPWHASAAHRATRSRIVQLPILRDASPGERGTAVRDHPVSYSQERREYGWREVVQAPPAEFENPDGVSFIDPFFETVVSA